MTGMQARLTQPHDPRLYSANRDLAHCFDHLLMVTSQRLVEARWDYLQKFMQREGVTDEDLGHVCQALARFAYVQVDDPRESMSACLARCGFLDLPEAARAAVMAYFGTVVLGMAWAGIHEATLGGVGPALTNRRLRWHGHRIVLLMRMSRLRRRWYLLRKRVRAAWRALTCGDKSEG